MESTDKKRNESPLVKPERWLPPLLTRGRPYRFNPFATYTHELEIGFATGNLLSSRAKLKPISNPLLHQKIPKQFVDIAGQRLKKSKKKLSPIRLKASSVRPMHYNHIISAPITSSQTPHNKHVQFKSSKFQKRPKNKYLKSVSTQNLLRKTLDKNIETENYEIVHYEDAERVYDFL